MKTAESNGAGKPREPDKSFNDGLANSISAAASGMDISLLLSLANADPVDPDELTALKNAQNLILHQAHACGGLYEASAWIMKSPANEIYRPPFKSHTITLAFVSPGDLRFYAPNGGYYTAHREIELAIVPAGQAFYARHDKDITLCNLSFCPSVFDRVRKTILPSSRKSSNIGLPLTLNIHDQILADLMGALYKALTARRCSAPFLELMAQTVSCHLLDHHCQVASALDVSRSSIPLLQHLDSYLTKRLDQPVTAQEAAAFLHMELPEFVRLLRAKTGRGFARYLLQLRLREAHRILSKKQLTVTQVAMETGFFDAAHLSTAFRKAFGVPPSQLTQ